MSKRTEKTSIATPNGTAPSKRSRIDGSRNGANIGFEAKLWAAADALRGAMDASEYKHIVLGIIFLKYISDAFEDVHKKLETDPASDPEDPLEYTAANVFWVPNEARWPSISAQARNPQIGTVIDKAMVAIEADNPRLKSVLPKEYARPSLGSHRLGDLINLISDIGLGDEEARKKDLLGRVYEYFLGRFASAEGKAGGEFYTPRCVVRLIVEMIEPFKGRVFDPCSGSGGMFVQSEEFVLSHGGRIGDISIYGQESNHTTWRLCRMNLAIRGIEGDIQWNPGGSFRQDAFPDLRADFIMANPPFNESSWGGEGLRDDPRWKYGIPPVSNSNFGWIQHFVYHLSPNGVAGFVMSNASMSSNVSGEGEIRRALIEADLVDCVIALPSKLFYTTQIAVCIWIVTRDRKNHKLRDRGKTTLLIDARKLGSMIDRKHRELQANDISRISNVYHAWRNQDGNFADIPGFCKSATIDEIRKQGYVITPGPYVGAELVGDDGEPFREKMSRLVAQLETQFTDSAKLEAVILSQLKSLEYGD